MRDVVESRDKDSERETVLDDILDLLELDIVREVVFEQQGLPVARDQNEHQDENVRDHRYCRIVELLVDHSAYQVNDDIQN